MNHKEETRFKQTTTHQMIVQALREDGCVCNPYTKTYDEQATYEGGNGNRQAFTGFNEEIIACHAILKSLTGERRANIRETIPVIDFAHIENTSLLYKYMPKKNDESLIDPTIITVVDSESSNQKKPMIDYILDEDESIINRAIMNHPLRAHFYNTLLPTSKDYHIQTAPSTRTFETAYLGIKLRPIVIYGQEEQAIQETEMQSILIEGETWIYYEPDMSNFENPDARTDENGTIIAKETTYTADGSKFIYKESHGKDGSHKIVLTEGDICLVLPPSTYSSMATKIIIFKCNDSTNDNEDNNIPRFEMFIVYASKVTPSRTLNVTELGASLPSYLVDDTLYEGYSKYIKAEKRYYGPASGLLSGYFCSPELDKDNADKINRWYFVDETSEAKKKGVTIDIGAKYFGGHILNRGNILDQPLKLTKHDYTNGSSYVNPPQDPYGKPYMGKATKIYDALTDVAKHMFESVEVPYRQWCDFRLSTLDSITTQLDYASEKLSQKQCMDLTGLSKEDFEKQPKLKLQSKMKSSSENPITIQDIRDYIRTCKYAISGDTLTLDIVGDRESNCYDYVVNENSTALNWGWATKNTEWNGTGNQTKSEFSKIFYSNYEIRYKYKRRSLINALCGLQVKMVTPFDLFKKSNKDNVILLYPDHPKFMPTELFLFSKHDLGLEEYNPVITGQDIKKSRGLCSFYNDKEKKIISFQVSEVIPILASKITKCRVHEPQTNAWHTGICNINYQYFYGMNSGNDDDDDSETFGVRQLFYPVAEDCYVYVLSPMEVSLGTVELYDADDERIDMRAGVNDIALMPMSYPEDYFSLSVGKNPDGSPTYVVNPSHRHVDLELLKGSYIIPGLPSFDNPEELRNYSKDNLSLSLFADMLGKGMSSISSLLLKKGLEATLNTWKISDSEQNPITIANLPEVLEGMLSMEPSLQRMAEIGFKIPLSDTDEHNIREVTYADFAPLFQLLHDKNIQERYTFKLTKTANPPLSSDDNMLSGMTKRLGTITIDSDITKTERTPLGTLRQIVDNIFGKNTDITRNDCIMLDKYLGTGTKAFMSFGTNRKDAPSDALAVSDALSLSLKTMIREIDNELQAMEIANVQAPIYSRFFTEDSVNLALFYDGNGKSQPRPALDPSYLVIDYAQYSKNYQLRNLVEYAKNSYGLSKTSYFRFLWWSIPTRRRCTMDEFLNDFQLVNYPSRYAEPNIGASRIQSRNAIQEYVYASALHSSRMASFFRVMFAVRTLSDSVIDSYMYDSNNVVMSEIEASKYNERRFKIVLNIPTYDASRTNLVPSGQYYTYYIGPYILEQGDVSPELLAGVAKYVKQRLEGTGTSDYYVRYVHGDDNVSGREDSLYFKRYRQLNNRMNTLNGTLHKAGDYFALMKNLDDENRVHSNFADSYSEYMTVLPIQSMEPLIFLKEQEATGTTLPMHSKFCYEKELDTLRTEINSKCVLTCNSCNVKDSCMFYNKDEIMKTTVSDARTIDLWVKDNELDLLYYDMSSSPEQRSPYLVDEETGQEIGNFVGFVNELKNMHKPYSSICKKITSKEKLEEVNYISRDLERLEADLKGKYPKFEKECKGGLGWLLGARYGTVNSYRKIPAIEAMFPEGTLPEYTYLTNAQFIFDEHSEILYRESTNRYPVKLELGSGDSKHRYSGTTKIKIPVGLKIFMDCQPQDEVYLVSDDDKDSEGNQILPVIYLNTVENLKYTFDLRDSDSQGSIQKGQEGFKELTDADDQNIYPQDVAQWSLNIAKGTCYEDPIGTPDKDINDGYDQYWMPRLRKNTEKGWIEIDGRPRYNASYQEVLTSEADLTPYDTAIGKPPVAEYINYRRKVMFDMDSILWVKENSTLVDASTDEPEVALHKARERQKAVLATMKTNLRIAIVRKPSVD